MVKRISDPGARVAGSSGSPDTVNPAPDAEIAPTEPCPVPELKMTNEADDVVFRFVEGNGIVPPSLIAVWLPFG
jgi:hypothetical protein